MQPNAKRHKECTFFPPRVQHREAASPYSTVIQNDRIFRRDSAGRVAGAKRKPQRSSRVASHPESARRRVDQRGSPREPLRAAAVVRHAAVGIPVDLAAEGGPAPELYEADAALDEPPGQQAGAGEIGALFPARLSVSGCAQARTTD
jgi:hypothetical protein